jgi:hypothetical protein
MASWTLAPCLASLRDEFNRLAPRRDKSSDGSIGDARHAASRSDHNPDSRGIVHAIDVDEDLAQPGLSMRAAAELLVDRHRRGLDERLTYIIYERAIWSATHSWKRRVYTGSNPHDKHAHFSASNHPPLERDTRPFGLAALLEEDMPTAKEIADELIPRLLKTGIGSSGVPTVGVALQTGAYQTTRKTLDAVTALTKVVTGLPEEILDRLGDSTDQTAAQQATVLRSVLGDARAAEVGRLLAGG